MIFMLNDFWAWPLGLVDNDYYEIKPKRKYIEQRIADKKESLEVCERRQKQILQEIEELEKLLKNTS
jgi:hypothetical protein